MTIKKNKGISLVEVLVASAIILIVVVSMFAVYSIMARFSISNTTRIQAVMLAEEGVDILRTMKDESFDTYIDDLDNDEDYYFEWNGTLFVSTTTPSMIDNVFYRSFRLSAVERDSNFDIVESGGTVDSDTRKADIYVSWRENNATTTISVETYVHNTFSN